jgi:hypothetical protein
MQEATDSENNLTISLLSLVKLREWECVEVEHHKDVGRTIHKWQKNGWHLHAYQATGRDVWVKHYLLFEKGE